MFVGPAEYSILNLLIPPAMDPAYKCADRDLRLLVYVHTAPGSLIRRQTIRATWGQDWLRKQLSMEVVFVTGKTNNRTIHRYLQYENTRYRDILRVDYVDHFFNLTFKTMSAIQWAATNCPRVPYVLKTDDDIFINIFTLVHKLEDMRSKGDVQNIFACYVWPTSKPKRTGKYKVSLEEFPGEYYPEFCSGSAYLMTSDVIASLASVTGSIKPFKLDDVHVTAFMREQANLILRPWNEAYLLYEEQFNQFLEADWQNFLFSHVHNLQRFRVVWQRLQATALKTYSSDMKIVFNNVIKAPSVPSIL